MSGTPQYSDEQVTWIRDRVAEAETRDEAVEVIQGAYPAATYQSVRVLLKARTGETFGAILNGGPPEPPPPATAPFEVEPLPPEGIPMEELLDDRCRRYKLKAARKEAEKLIEVEIKLDGPIALFHYGDPHVDDDGCDLPTLRRHAALVQQTEGMFACNVGDTTNNWIGRLAHLYKDQSTSLADARRLLEWFLSQHRWLYLVLGNHDEWRDSELIRQFAARTSSLVQSHSARLALNFPNGKRVTVCARHNFKGHSMYNTAHGQNKAATFGQRDHILIAGHTHTSGYNIVKDQLTGMLSHCVQVASYKTHDRYAEEHGFKDHSFGPCVTTIIDPDAAEETGLVQTIWNPELAALTLGAMRARYAAKQRCP